MQPFDLNGKVAIITGCNTGLGQGMAIGLAKAGADIVGVGVAEAPETQAQVEALGRKFHFITADLIQQKDIDSIVSQAVEVMGHIDILINNAGIIRRQDLLEFGNKDWDDVININQKNRVLPVASRGETVCEAGQRRQDHQYRLHVVIPGGDPRALLHRQ